MNGNEKCEWNWKKVNQSKWIEKQKNFQKYVIYNIKLLFSAPSMVRFDGLITYFEF